MRLFAFVVMVGAVGCGPGAEKAYRETRLNVDLERATPREWFRILERATGYPIDVSGCDCIEMDQPSINFKVRDISAWGALQLTESGLFEGSHCGGGWNAAKESMKISCGLFLPSSPGDVIYSD